METENKLLKNIERLLDETDLALEDCIRVAIKEFDDQEALQKEYEKFGLESYVKYLIVKVVCEGIV